MIQAKLHSPLSLLAALYILVLWLASCTGSKPQSATMTGILPDFNDNPIYVYGGDFYNRMDTIPVRQKTVDCTIEVDTLSLVYMYLPDGTHQPLFIAPGDKLTIEADSGKILVRGSKENDEYNRFVEEVETAQFLFLKEGIEKKLRNYVNEHPDSYVTICLLKKYLFDTDEPNLKLLGSLLQKLTGANRDREMVVQLESQIEEHHQGAVGQIFPYYSFKDNTGKTINRLQFKDKFLLLHFWASWDEESRLYNEDLRHFVRQEKGNKDLAFMGYSLDADRDAWLQAIREDSLSWVQVHDSLGFYALLVQQCAVYSLPYNMLIGPSDKIIARNIPLEEIPDIIEKNR